MEMLDAFTIFISGICLGFIIGCQVHKRIELPLAYQQGRNDGANEIWPHLVDAWKDNIRLRCLRTSGAKKDGGSNGDEKVV